MVRLYLITIQSHAAVPWTLQEIPTN